MAQGDIQLLLVEEVMALSVAHLDPVRIAALRELLQARFGRVQDQHASVACAERDQGHVIALVARPDDGADRLADEATIEDYNVFYNNTSGHRNNIATGANSRTAASAAECGYTVWSCTISYDGGTDMNLVSAGQTISDGTWTGTVKSISDNGDGTGTLSIETLSGGMPANNDAFTIDGGPTPDADVDGTFSIDATTDYELTSAAIMAGTDAEAIKLDWTTTPDHTGYYTAGIPRRTTAGGAILKTGGKQ